MSADEHPTLIPCLACGGEFRRLYEPEPGRYRTELCRWCSSGAMSLEQIQKWRQFSERRKTDPESLTKK